MTSHSAALTTDTHEALVGHLDRGDRQEDLCFALYRPSSGATRTTAVVHGLVLPEAGERRVHGNVAFTSDYFLRAAFAAADADAGLVLLHSHPRGYGWQGMSSDDVDAELGHAAQAQEITGLPLVGMTMGTGEASWSARVWAKTPGGEFARRDCDSVRVVGDQLRMTYHPELRPIPLTTHKQLRTVSAWGERAQADLARLRVGIVGAGSVGSMVAEALARTGVQHLVLLDFDRVKLHNLDRLLHATERDVRLARSKVEVLSRALRDSATAASPQIDALELSVVEEAGWLAALDCDVIFSCVDRPWPRSALNLLAYAHLIPVIDGGIRVTVEDGALLGADWKAHVAAPSRRCLECVKQYLPEHVAMEREGRLDDPEYIKGLPKNSPLRASENVFAFSANVASLEVLQLLSMAVAPQGIADIGSQNHHFVTGELDVDTHSCTESCLYSGRLLARADHAGLSVTAAHRAAEVERAERAAMKQRPGVRLRRLIDRLVAMLSVP
jgi:molybdopterin/thiamine biosynthesis adenylyltransferase